MSNQIEDDAQEAFLKLVNHNENAALSFLTANFVGLMAFVTQEQGGDPGGEIRIEGIGENSRDITIHAKKGGNNE